MKSIYTPASRATDPATSALAEQEINISGTRRGQQKIVARAVEKHPGLTSAELSNRCVLDRYQVARRAPECETAGALLRGEKRNCRVLGRLAITWWPVEVTA